MYFGVDLLCMLELKLVYVEVTLLLCILLLCWLDAKVYDTMVVCVMCRVIFVSHNVCIVYYMCNV
jgi:hypothetical protein